MPIAPVLPLIASVLGSWELNADVEVLIDSNVRIIPAIISLLNFNSPSEDTYDSPRVNMPMTNKATSKSETCARTNPSIQC
jgi:hypothetical protein